MTRFAYELDTPAQTTLGLIVLQSDETIEQEFRRALPAGAHLHVTRVPSGAEVTADTLQAMEAHLQGAASLFPEGLQFDAVGYGCTSGTAQIGADRVAARVGSAAQTRHVTEPVSALQAACTALNVTRLAFLSPYIAEVSARLRAVLNDAGLETPLFGSFNEAEERKVARITPVSITEAGAALARQGHVDALFLSCTNLRTFEVITALEAQLGMPVLSSNQVLLWHMARMAGLDLHSDQLGQLVARY